jgi:NADPH-dependent glutamate synthase beta subunit-like oxidoreductase
VIFKTGKPLGKNVPVEDLRREFDAMLLTGGAESPARTSSAGTRA